MQSYTQRLVIVGAKSSKGEYDGKPYDKTTLYVHVPLDPTTGTMKGATTTEYVWGKSTNFNRLEPLDFPLEAEVEFQTVSNGRSSKIVVVDVSPV